MNTQRPLPQVTQQAFENALQRVRNITNIPQFAGKPSFFVQATLASPPRRATRGMDLVFQSIREDATLQATIHPEGVTEAQVLYGAAIMFLLLSELGEPFLRRISPETVKSYDAERETYYRRLLGNLKDTPPHDVDASLEAISQADESTGYRPFRHQDLYEENPAFKDWMEEEMDVATRYGATRLYGLVRKQADADKWAKLLE